MEGRRARKADASLRVSVGALVAAIVLAAAGCGSSSSSSSESTTASEPASESGKAAQPSSPGESKPTSNGRPQKEISSYPVRATIVHFGSKASAAEQAAATDVVQTFYSARAEEDWPAACPLLTPGMKLGAKQVGGRGDDGCGRGIKSLTASSTLEKGETKLAHVMSLRRRGNEGFLVYTSGRGAEFGLLIKHVDGSWKVSGLNPTPIG